MHVCNYLIVAIYNIFQKYTCPNPGRKLNILRFLIKKLLKETPIFMVMFLIIFLRNCLLFFPGNQRNFSFKDFSSFF